MFYTANIGNYFITSKHFDVFFIISPKRKELTKEMTQKVDHPDCEATLYTFRLENRNFLENKLLSSDEYGFGRLGFV